MKKLSTLTLVLLTCLGASAQVLSPLSGKTRTATDIPLVYEVENTGENVHPVLPTKAEGRRIDPLPDPLEWSDGSGRATDFSDWAQRRGEIAKEIQHYEIGTKPAVASSAVTAKMDVDTLRVTVTINGEALELSATIHYPSTGEAPYPLMIGMDNISLTNTLITSRPIAYMNFSSSQVNGYSQFFDSGKREFERLYPDLVGNGAYSEWAWGLSRLIDGLQQLGPEVSKIDTKHIGVTGCSYAGKMALFCGAFDERIALTIAQEPGGGGAAAWRFSRVLNKDVLNAGDSGVESLDRTDYHWFMEKLKNEYGGKDVSYLPYDHHELAAMVCPRALLMLGNPTQIWLADQSGFVSMNAAAKVWEQYGIGDRVGYSFVSDHGHCQLPETQEPEVEAYLDRFLLGKEDVNTNVRIASDFYLSTANGTKVVAPEADLDWWMGWWGIREPAEFVEQTYVPNGPAIGTKEQLPLLTNWSSSVTGDAAADGKIYSGTATFSGQWGEIGGSGWGCDVNQGTKHIITVKTSEPLPEGLQWKISLRDEFGEAQAEMYPPIQAGVNELVYELTTSYSYFAIQRYGQERLTVPFESVTREVVENTESSIRTIDNDDQKKVISRQIYSVAGMPRKNLAKGVNICNEQLEDGHTRTKKVIVK